MQQLKQMKDSGASTFGRTILAELFNSPDIDKMLGKFNAGAGQDDLDDATGNTLPFFDGKVNLFPSKDLTCEDENLDDYYSVAGTYTYCLKESVIPTIILQYVKNNTDKMQTKKSAAKSKKYGSQLWDSDIPSDEYFDE